MLIVYSKIIWAVRLIVDFFQMLRYQKHMQTSVIQILNKTETSYVRTKTIEMDGGGGGGGRVVRWSWVNFQCRGVLLVWIGVGQGPTALVVGGGGGCLDIFTLIYPFSSFSLSLGDDPI